MFYPQEFKERAMKLYPDNKDLYQKLEDGDGPGVNNILHTALGLSISYQEGLSASSIEEIWHKSMEIKNKVQLFYDWVKLYEEQKNG